MKTALFWREKKRNLQGTQKSSEGYGEKNIKVPE